MKLGLERILSYHFTKGQSNFNVVIEKNQFPLLYKFDIFTTEIF